MSTGAYLRVQRAGKWHNIEVEHLTSEERRDLFKDRSNEEMLKWMDMLCGNIDHLELLYASAK